MNAVSGKRENGMRVKPAINTNDPNMVPYIGERSPQMLPDIFVRDAIPDDERLWVPVSDGVWTRPLCFSLSQGYWTHLLRVRRSGVFNRHRHASPVHGFVLKGSWYYLEGDWVAEAGSYIYEPPGDTHTLIVPDDVDEMISFFHTTGTLTFVDPEGRPTGFEDVFSRFKMVSDYFNGLGFGEDYMKQFIR